jgi:hypothetical protein
MKTNFAFLAAVAAIVGSGTWYGVQLLDAVTATVQGLGF